ncbi:MAG: hypothetical protein V4572_05450 [Bacteroidota bacterium]
MSELIKTLYNKEKELEEQLKKLPKEKWKIWRLIAVGILTPFVGPYIPMRRGTLAERMGYQDAFLMFALICVIFIPYACYAYIQKINNEIFEVELELELLNRKEQIKEQFKNFEEH